MKLKSIVVAAASVAAIAGCSATVASAQSGDAGQAPQNRAQCKKFLKGVDKALVWENKNYAKQLGKLTKKRDALTKQATTLGAQQAEIQRRLTEIESALEDQANPLAEDAQNSLVLEYNELAPIGDQNERDLQDIADTLDGMKWDFSQLKKNHTLNVRSTTKYRKQVATYCKKLKK